jgi:hypothetical protein
MALKDYDELHTLWQQLDDHQRAALLSTARSAAVLGPIACGILERLGERLAMGARNYGDFPAGRSWRKEAVEEQLDGLVYLTMELMEKGG